MRPRSDEGFTLIELLVVMIIMGILLAIAVPTIIDQRAKAQDTATRQDTSVAGKAVTAWFMEQAAAPVVEIAGGRLQVGGEDIGKVSPGTVVDGADPAVVDTTGWTAGAWCLAMTNPSGAVQTVKFSAAGGLENGACSTSTTP